MQFIDNLFLQKPSDLTVEVDSENHIYRSKQAVDGLITTPLFPRLNKSECTVTKVWDSVTSVNKTKQAFGYRKLDSGNRVRLALETPRRTIVFRFTQRPSQPRIRRQAKEMVNVPS